MADEDDDIAGFLVNEERRAQGRVFATLNDDPEKGARAIQIADVSGVPPAVVHGDLDHYDNQTKARMSNQLVSSNEFLKGYINSHDLAATVSNDDLGQLDQASQVLQKIRSTSILYKMGEGYASTLPPMWEGFKQGFDSEGRDKELKDLWNFVDSPAWKGAMLSAAPAVYAAHAVKSGMSLFNAAVFAGAAGIGEAATQVTGSEAWGKRLVRDMIQLAQVGLSGQSGFHLHPTVKASINEAGRVTKAAELYAGAGKEPPVGTHPFLDLVKDEQADLDGKNLKEAIKESQASVTRERSPELYAAFVRQHVGEAKIGLSAEKVAELYGDKAPAPDDNILGWVPRISEQLETAKGTGADIEVPLADFLARVDPKIAKELEDHVRMRSEGVTKEEAKLAKEVEVPEEPTVEAPTPIDTVRKTAGLEPFEVFHGSPHQFEAFDISKIGTGEGAQSYGHGLYFAENRKVAADYADRLGPKGAGNLNTKDAVAYLRKGREGELTKEAAHEIELGLEDFKHFEKRVPSDVELAEYLEGSYKGQGNLYRTRIKANKEHFLDWDKPLAEQRHVFDKIAAHDILGDVKVKGGHSATGADLYHAIGEHIESTAGAGNLPMPEYLAKLDSSQAKASKALHEAGIPGIKYLDHGSRIPEAPAEMLAEKMELGREYAKLKQKGVEKLTPQEMSRATELEKKLDDIDTKLAEHAKSQETRNFVLFDASLTEITHKNDIPIKTPVRKKPQQLSLDLPKQLNEREALERGTLINVADYDRYLRLIEQRHAEDLAYATKKAQSLARKQMTEAWKADESRIRSEVVEDINRQPVFSADTYFRDGTFAGDRLAGVHRIGEEFLTEEQKASLPPSFYSKSGLDPDGVAWRFGYSSGEDMVNDLAGLHQQREASGKNPAAFRRDAIDRETARRMDAKYGEAKKDILEEAKNQAVSDTQLEMLHEETLGMAMKAGVEFSLSKADIAAMVKERVDASLMGDVSSDKMLAAAGRAGRAEASALLKGDFAEAFRQRALKEIDAIMAKQAMELEAAREKFDATAKRFRSRSLDSVAQEYTNFIHDILLRVGEPVNRSVQDLAAEIKREGYTDLGGFVKGKSDATYGLLNIPIPDFLLDPNFRKPVDQLTTVEFRELHDAVQAMAKLGRDENKIIRAGESADRAEVLKEMKAELGTFPLKEYNATAPKTLSPTNIFRTFLASSTNLETLLNRWDRNNPRGVFNKYIVYPLSAAANYKAALTREFSKPYGDLGKLPNQNKLVKSPIIDPLTISAETPEGKPLANFTQGNVQVMIHNAGNEAQWIKFAKGWGADPDALMSWLHQNSTKEMWDRAQKMGDTIFKPAFEKAQTVYHNIYGIAPEKIELSPVQTPFGEYAGWYHPLIKDPIREVYIDADGKRISGQSKVQMGGGVYDNTDNFHARTTNGYTKSRTNAFYPVDLSPDMIPIRLSQMLHDIAFRAPIIEAEKVFGDASFRNEVTKHYGEHYAAGLKPYLQGLAGAEGIPSKAQGIARSISEYFRQNVISAYIGFNPYTALKHGPTALVLSMKQVGIGEFLGAVKDLYRRSDDINLSNKEFVDKWSEEVGRRSRHWQDTIIGEHAHIYGEGTVRERVMEAGSWLVAQSDMASVRPTWLAAYRNAVREGSTHGEAIDLAEASVRKAHGSTAITNQPALVTGGGPMHGWLTSIYGFFGTVMQRRIELAHAVNDAYQLGKGGDIAGVAKSMPDITARTFAYVIWPTLVEEWVTGLTTEDKRGWGTHLFTAAAGGLASSVLYLRDITHSLLHGYDPGVGLLSSPLHDIKNLTNDLKKGKKMFSKENAGKLVGDFTTVFGEFTGLAPKEIGNLLRAGTDLFSGQAKPKTMKDWQLLLTRGLTKKREVK